MPIRPEMVDYIRTSIRGDYDQNDRLEARLDVEGWDGFTLILGIVFYMAVHRVLDEQSSRNDVIRFVADMRSAMPADAPPIDADTAEGLVRATLNPDIDLKIDQRMAALIQGQTIIHVLSQPDVTEKDLDTLLAEAVQVANSHLDA